MRTIVGAQGLLSLVGEALGTSDWWAIDQEAVDLFGRVTGDDQWIHIDADRAARGPFGSTVVHGYFVLSLLPRLTRSIWLVEGARMSINYGLNRVRFTTPVPVGSRVRAHSTLVDATLSDDSVRAEFQTVIELENASKPASLVEHVSLYRF